MNINVKITITDHETGRLLSETNQVIIEPVQQSGPAPWWTPGIVPTTTPQVGTITTGGSGTTNTNRLVLNPSAGDQPKRKPGRPRKHPLPDQIVEKRKPGRPRKAPYETPALFEIVETPTLKEKFGQTLNEQRHPEQ